MSFVSVLVRGRWEMMQNKGESRSINPPPNAKTQAPNAAIKAITKLAKVRGAGC